MAIATRTDEEVKKDVVDHLYWDDRVDASSVKVKVTEGEVDLSGTVPDYIAYEAAGEDAWELAGVRLVRNNLTVKYAPGISLPPDAELKGNIENLLLWQSNIDSTNIDVDVENGWVVLRGSVDAYWQKVNCQNIVAGVRGVSGLTNELAVVPQENVSDKLIAEDITAAMERNINIDMNYIDVKVENGKVTLFGSVGNLQAFRAAKRIAENTLGVVTVENELSIR